MAKLIEPPSVNSDVGSTLPANQDDTMPDPDGSNCWLTPAAHLSLNTQVIRPTNDSLDTAWTLGSRLQLDF